MSAIQKGAEITVLIEPDMRKIRMARPKTAAQLLEKLNLLPETAIIVRNGELLTHDRRIWPDDELLVRIVTSCG